MYIYIYVYAIVCMIYVFIYIYIYNTHISRTWATTAPRPRAGGRPGPLRGPSSKPGGETR